MSDERDGVVYGTAGGPYCAVCGAPVETEALDVDVDAGGFVTTVPGRSSCPNGCDPRQDESLAYTITTNSRHLGPTHVDDVFTIRRTR
jgi:hypothetical protein